MIVRDKTAELEQFLESEYRSQIDTLKTDAEDYAAKALASKTSAARETTDGLWNVAKQQAKAYDHMTISAARLEASRVLSKAQLAFVTEVSSLLREELEGLSKTKKQSFVKALHKVLLTKIADEGYNVKNFAIYCPKDVKITGASPTLKETEVVAESDTLVFRVGVEDLLAQKQDDIVKKALQFVSEHTEL